MPWNSTVVDSEILAVHAALVPNGDAGEVVLFGGDEHWIDQTEPNGNFRKTRVYDVKTHALVTAQIPSPDSDVFCAHHAFAADGRLLIAGGTQKWSGVPDAHAHALDFLGHRRCWLYNYKQRTWTEITKLNKNPDQPDEEHSGGRWYPGLVTLANGEVAAFFGHPDQQDFRHRNTLPERYNQAGNFWINMRKVMGTAGEPVPQLVRQPGDRRFLFFPRVYQLPNGRLFFATPMPANFSGGTEGTHFSTAYDVFSGDYADPKIAEPEGAYHEWNRPAVLLPLLPTEDYRVRILFVGGVNPMRLDLGSESPAWLPTAGRAPSIASRDRVYSNAVLLPTGEVCVVGGVHDVGNENSADGTVRPEDPVLEAEIYSPGINWNTGMYSNADTWSVKQAAVYARNYHSTALLLPNGKVWVAGGNFNAGSGNPDDDVEVVGVKKKRGTKKIELYEPDYIATPNRIQITDSPKVLTYNEPFIVEIDRPATNVKYVALIRAGSVTHSTDNDQRFVALTIESRNGNTLNLSAPPNGNVAPPGYYMLWVVDNSDKPCQLAKFIRVAYLGCTVITDRSTFSKEEVDALGGGGQATFNNAIYVQFDGFIHTELMSTPSFTVEWVDTNAPVPNTDFTLIPAGRLQEVNPGFPDISQRITFPFHVRFRNLNTYAGFTDTRLMRVTFSLGQHRCSQTLDLTYNPNPYMIDINAAENNPAWLSTDVRVFSIVMGETKFGDITQLDSPIQFIRQCLDKLNNPANNGNALFESLSTSASLELASHFFVLPVLNYAIARVRYRATTTTAQRVKCFFRMFNVQATGLEYNPNTTYRRTAISPNTVPLIGTAGGEIVSIPFFASERVETVQDQPNATSMASQLLDTTYEIRNIAPNPTGAEVTVYFGCWLDINQSKKRIPLNPGTSDGPWPEASCRSIQELTRGRHMCVVSEIFFEPDPTQAGETPDSSDNLSQRNLAILHSDNPGGPDSHTVMHTFEIKPSELFFDFKALSGGTASASHLTAVSRQFRLDELIFRWHNLPRESEVTIYFSDIDTADIQALSMFRRSPLACEVVDKHTLKMIVAGATWIPIPGGRNVNIPALLSIKLPDTVVYGQEYHVSIHQVSGRGGKIIGSCEFRIPVSKAELILDDEIRNLSVFKHVLTTIPTDNRWYPLMQRYVHHFELKVNALGGNAGSIHPNPNGSGQPYDPRHEQLSVPEIIANKFTLCCKQISQRLWIISVILTVIALALILLLFQQ
nr:galactose oxidase early set domain-containing protein [Nitrosomonas nitrosa]